MFLGSPFKMSAHRFQSQLKNLETWFGASRQELKPWLPQLLGKREKDSYCAPITCTAVHFLHIISSNLYDTTNR